MPENEAAKIRARKIQDWPYRRSADAAVKTEKGTYARRITDNTLSRAPAPPKYDQYQEALEDYNHGEYSRAVEKLLTLFSENHSPSPGFLMKTESMILLAKAYANIGELKPARTWCEKAITTEKLNPEIYYLLSTILQSDRKIDEAVKALKQAIYLDPEFIMAHFTLGMLQLQKNMPAEGRKSLQNALRLLKLKDPDDILLFSEGMTAGRLIETLKSMQIKESHEPRN
jgi:chemotaxis protein methyltransferase CheR